MPCLRKYVTFNINSIVVRALLSLCVLLVIRTQHSNHHCLCVCVPCRRLCAQTGGGLHRGSVPGQWGLQVVQHANGLWLPLHEQQGRSSAGGAARRVRPPGERMLRGAPLHWMRLHINSPDFMSVGGGRDNIGHLNILQAWTHLVWNTIVVTKTGISSQNTIFSSLCLSLSRP